MSERPFKLDRRLLARLRTLKSGGDWVWKPGFDGKPNTLFGTPYTVVDEPSLESTYTASDHSARASTLTMEKIMDLTRELERALPQGPLSRFLRTAKWVSMSSATLDDLRIAADRNSGAAPAVETNKIFGPMMMGIPIRIKEYLPRGVIGMQGPGGAFDVRFIVPPLPSPPSVGQTEASGGDKALECKHGTSFRYSCDECDKRDGIG